MQEVYKIKEMYFSVVFHPGYVCARAVNGKKTFFVFNVTGYKGPVFGSQPYSNAISLNNDFILMDWN